MFIVDCYGSNGMQNLNNWHPNWRSVRRFLRNRADWVVSYRIRRYRHQNAVLSTR